MKRFLQNSKALFSTVFLLMTIFFTNESFGQTNTWDGSTDANWNTAANWSLNLVPTSAHDVVIPDNFNVTVNTAAVCNTFIINQGANSNTVTISGTNSLTVSGAITINNGTGNGDNKIIAVGTGTLTCGSVTIADTTNNNRDSEITISTGTVNVTGNITMNGAVGRNAIRFSNAGTLNCGGTISGGDLIASTGTVNYNAAGNQTVGTYTYNNLTLSGSGVKTLGTTTVNAKLSIQGTATTAGTTPTYGGSAILEYKGSAAQTTSIVEFPATLAADLIIDNTSGVTLNAAKTVTGFITLTSGALIANNFNISLSGNWTNNGGSFTAGTSTVTFTGTSAIGGTVATTFFNLTKNTAVTVTNAVDGTTVSGTMSITAGTFIGNNSLTTTYTINVNNFSLTGGTFDSCNTSLAGIATILAISGSYLQTATSTFTNTGAGVTEVLFTGGGNTTYTNAYTTAVANWQYAIVHVANNTTLTLSTDLMQWGVVDTGAIVDAGSTLVTGTNLLRAGTTAEVWEINGTLRTAVTAGLNGSTTTTLVSTNTPVFTLGALSNIEYNATSPQTVTSRADYANITFTGNSTKTAAGTFSASKDLTINSTATFAAGNFTHNLAGNWINNGTFTPDTSTINFNGTSAISGSSTNTFNNISIAAASSLTAPASSNVNVQGNWTNNNVFTNNSGTVTFNGTTAQSISGTTTFYNLTLTNSGVKTFSSVITTSANLSIASGAQADLGTGLTHSANSLTLGAQGTNLGTWGSTTSAATFKNNTYFGATTGVVNVTTNTSAIPTVTPTVGTYTYNGLVQGPNTATNTGTATSYTFSYVGVSGTVYGPSATQPTNAGDYTVTATVGDSVDGFYRTASSSATSFSILVRVLTITADSDTKVYGQTYTVGSGSTTFTSSGLQNGETIGSITTSSAGAANTAAVGTYSIIPTLATGGTFTASNYSITYTDGTLTVNTASLTITVDSSSKDYGQTYTVGSGSTAFTSSGLQNGETIGSITIASTGAVATAAVGSYSIVGTTATGGTFTASNYSITYVNGTLTVNPASLIITANNGSKVYGTTQSTPVTGSVAFGSIGLQNGETIGTVTLTYGSGALAATNAVGSTSTISPSAATGGTFTVGNYNIIYITDSGTLTVTAATLIITANNANKIYGATQSTPVSGSADFGSTGLQNGETIGTVTLTYGSGAIVATDAVGSTSTITPSAAIGGTFTASNYNITYTPNSGTLTVTAAALTITADDAVKCFGTTYTLGTTAYTSSGLQNSETIGSVTLSSTGAASGAAVGPHAITPSAATGGTFTASNYNITYVDGSLTVNDLPNAPSGTDGAICTAGTVNLSASVNGGETVDWYDASSGGTLLLANSTGYTTPSISSTTIYYAEARNTTTGCVSGSRAAVTAFVYTTFTSGAIDTTGETVCYNGDPSVIGSTTAASGGDGAITYVWQANGIDIPGSNSVTYDPPTGLTMTTTYTRFAKDNTCNPTFTLSTGSWVVTISNNNTWTGSVSTAWTNIANWLCGVVPAAVSNVTISTATFYPEISSNVTINTLTLDSGTTLKVNAANGLTVTDVINNAGTLTLESNANLIQVNNVANTGSGSTIVKRNSSALKRLDYTLWSSPVTGQGLYAFSSLTFANRFYQYLTASNTYSSSLGFNITGLNGNGVNGTDTNNVPFTTGKGYLIRMPWNHPTTATVWNGQFTGTANNGDYTIGINDNGSGFRYNLIGNPYPSPISAVDFVAANRQSGDERITGVLYFWRETNNTTANNAYCSWSPAGGGNGTFVTNSQPEAYDLNGVIQTGQGFIVEAESGASAVEFDNSIRLNNTAGQFFRTTEEVNTVSESNRIWLNVTNATGLFCQTAFGYMTDATMGYDGGIDGRLINDGDIALYSTVGNESLVIQGRALPFDLNDVVPLGLRITNSGDYAIAIDHVDGLFSEGQTVYLRDNLTSTIHNLTTGTYNFNSDAGTFASRFEIIYQIPLSVGTPVFNANHVTIYQNEVKDFVIKTGNIVMSEVKVFDIRGRLLLEKNDINDSQTTINVGQANQVLLIQITSQDGLVVTKKVIR